MITSRLASTEANVGKLNIFLFTTGLTSSDVDTSEH